MNKTENLHRHFPDPPNWVPLEQVVGLSRCPYFMAMGEITQDGITICLYKHIHMRRYLNLDTDGHAYRFANGRYEPIGLPEAIHHAFT